MESEARKAHVICVVYAIDDPHSFSRILTYWLPYFRNLGVNVSDLYQSKQTQSNPRGQVPVILVGNKIDLRGGVVTNDALKEEITPIMNDFKVRTHLHIFSRNYIGLPLGSRVLYRVFSPHPSQCLRSVLLRPKSSITPYCTIIRL